MRVNLSNKVAIVALLPLLLLTGCCGEFFRDSKDVVSVTISPTDTSIQPGQTQQFSTTGTFDGGSTGNVTAQTTWTSSDPAIATIDDTGLATGVAPGTVTITGDCQCYKTKTNLTVSSQTASLELMLRPFRPDTLFIFPPPRF